MFGGQWTVKARMQERHIVFSLFSHCTDHFLSPVVNILPLLIKQHISFPPWRTRIERHDDPDEKIEREAAYLLTARAARASLLTCHRFEGRRPTVADHAEQLPSKSFEAAQRFMTDHP